MNLNALLLERHSQLSLLPPGRGQMPDTFRRLPPCLPAERRKAVQLKEIFRRVHSLGRRCVIHSSTADALYTEQLSRFILRSRTFD